MKKNRDRLFLVINILLSIMAGAIIYYMISPEVLFVQQIDGFIGKGFHVDAPAGSRWLLSLVRNYVPDMMWGYALVFALCLISGSDYGAELRRIFVVAAIFSAVMEALQLIPGVHGTFDVWDIVAEVIAEGVAVFIIRNRIHSGQP
ncbi:MAG: hypothetical protein ACI4DO_05470 [Roseburia sp.]